MESGGGDDIFSIHHLAPLRKGRSRVEIINFKVANKSERDVLVSKLTACQRKALARVDPLSEFVEKSVAETTLANAYANVCATSAAAMFTVLNKVFQSHKETGLRLAIYNFRALVQTKMMAESRRQVQEVEKTIKERTVRLEKDLVAERFKSSGQGALQGVSHKLRMIHINHLDWAMRRLKKNADVIATENMALSASATMIYAWREQAEMQAKSVVSWRSNLMYDSLKILLASRLRYALSELRLKSHYHRNLVDRRKEIFSLLLVSKFGLEKASKRMILTKWEQFSKFYATRQHHFHQFILNQRQIQIKAVFTRWYINCAKSSAYDIAAIAQFHNVVNSIIRRKQGLAVRALRDSALLHTNLECLQVSANYSMVILVSELS